MWMKSLFTPLHLPYWYVDWNNIGIFTVASLWSHTARAVCRLKWQHYLVLNRVVRHTARGVCGLKWQMPQANTPRLRHTAWAVCGLKFIDKCSFDKWNNVIPFERYVDWNPSGPSSMDVIVSSYRTSDMWIEISRFIVIQITIPIIPCERYVDWSLLPI